MSSITLAEITYLEEKGRVAPGTLDGVLAAFDVDAALFVEVPFDRHVAAPLAQVARAAVPDMSDCVIAATATYLAVPLITRDARIQRSGVPTIW